MDTNFSYDLIDDYRRGGYSSRPSEPKNAYSAPPSRTATPPPEEPLPTTATIPTLPSGRTLTINCLSTWGDIHYIGLNGIELYDARGEEIVIRNPSLQSHGNPDSINVLPEYSDDPRVASNLFNSLNRTMDDNSVWLAPFTQGADHLVTVEFGVVQRISMVRVWNYNKSRPHTYRGVKEMEMYLDGVLIFRGEVGKASGGMVACEEYTESILFTTDEEIVGRIEAKIMADAEKWRVEEQMSAQQGEIARPATRHGRDHDVTTDGNSRPVTVAGGRKANISVALNASASFSNFGTTLASMSSSGCPRGQTVRLSVLSNWGDMLHIGCGHIFFVVSQHPLHPFLPLEKILSVAPSHPIHYSVNGTPRVFDGTNGDSREVIRALFSDTFPTFAAGVEGVPGWYVKSQQEGFEMTITLSEAVSLPEVIFLNFNDTLASSSRGAKRVEIAVDGKIVTPQGGAYIRKAPGSFEIDYSRTVHLSTKPDKAAPNTLTYSTLNEGVQDAIKRARLMHEPFPQKLLDILGFEPVSFPVGYVYRIEISSTHGDSYYVGLNGIEMFDVRNEQIPISSHSLQAVPRDVTVLPQNATDCRVLGNLIDGCNASSEDENIWLAPFSPGLVNVLYIVFEEPVALSRLTLYNYSKTPSRGVRQVTVYADDTLIYSGCLKAAPSHGGSFPQHMIFTNCPPPELDLNLAVPASAQIGGEDSTQKDEVTFYDSGHVCVLYSISLPQNDLSIIRSTPSTLTAYPEPPVDALPNGRWYGNESIKRQITFLNKH